MGFGILILWGCGARDARPQGPSPRRSLSAEPSLAVPYGSPAKFRYHPRSRGRPRAERVLADGRRILAGERGERWLFDPRAKTLTPGGALAPEPLIAVLGDGRFSFVGASGTSYVSEGPLAPFERSSAPTEALASVTAAGSAILGVRQGRALLRSEDLGVSWGAVGPEGVALVSVALDEKGRGLALATPEALYGTDDHGATFRRIDAPTIGALELSTTLEGEIRAQTPLGEARFVYDKRLWQRIPAETKPASVAVMPAPARGPDAGALAVHRATFNGSSYLELVPGSERGSWELLSGPLDGALARSLVPLAKGCRDVRLAAFGRHVLIACFRETDESVTQRVRLYESDDGGARFREVAGRVDGDPTAFRLAVGAEGRWVLSGVCPPGAVPEGCAPSGIQRRREADEPVRAPAGSKRQPVPLAGVLSATPSLSGPALELTFAVDGGTAYAVGRRTKTGRFGLFVSRDGGRSFAPQDLDLGQVAADDGDDDVVERSPGTRVESLSTAEDGAVAVTFAHYGKRTLVVTDDQGKLLSSAEPPEERALLGAAGLRALSIAPKSRQLWESLDGGVTFNPTSILPLDLCPGEENCEVPLRCAAAGCVIGRELSRIGWGGQAPEDAALLPPPLRAVRQAPERKVLSPIVCALSGNPFTPLPDVIEPPGAHEAAIGQTAWFAVAEDASRAAVSVFHASKGRVESTRLIEPSARPEQHAFAVLDQVEGVAAVRYRLPEAKGGQTNLSDVELVWSNFFEGRVVRQRLVDGGAYVPGDYVSSGTRAQRAQPDLLSIAAGGLYLRLHKSAPSEQPTLFLDGRRVETLAAPAWPVDPRYPARAEMVHIGSAHVPVLIAARGAALARARAVGSGFEYDAFATGMVDPASFGLIAFDNIAYAGGRAGLYVEIQDLTGAVASAQIFPFRADGAVVDSPVNVPTQRALGDRPEGCDSERRTRTARVVASFQSGTRHPVVVTDSVDGPRTLITGYAVLYGTPESPCAAAFEATGVAAETGQATREAALILPDDMEHSVLFRRSPDRSARVEYRHMACRFDPGAEIPPEVYRAIK